MKVGRMIFNNIVFFIALFVVGVIKLIIIACNDEDDFSSEQYVWKFKNIETNCGGVK